jgi:hypothetical protein
LTRSTACGESARVAEWPEELRFGIALLLTVGLFAAAARLARNRGGERAMPHWLCDALLLAMVGQYVVVGIAGILGILSGGAIVVGTIVVIGVMWWLGGAGTNGMAAEGSRAAALRDPVAWSLVILLVELAGIVNLNWVAPVKTNDALTYHLPAAVSWLQSGRIGLYDVWFYNPANTYSPLAGSVFAAWYLGPAGSDVLARFVEIPAMVLLWAAVASAALSFCGNRRSSLWIAALLALAVTTSRPFICQADSAKDDLYVAAFLASAVAALARGDSAGSIGALRLGAAVGLFFATKYTTLLSVPVLLLAIDGLARMPWRKQMIVVGAMGVLAGPWYLRNAVLTGNPLFPMDVNFLEHRLLPGLFTMQPSDRLRSAGQVLTTFTDGYYVISIWLAGVLALIWLLAWARAKEAIASPVGRMIWLGPPIGMGLFVLISPFAEPRFVGPELVLLMMTPILLHGRWPRLAVAISAVLAAMALFGGFVPGVLIALIGYAAVPAMVLVVARLALACAPPRQYARQWSAAGIIVAGGVGALIYTQWPAFARERIDVAERLYSAPLIYPTMAGAWQYVNHNVAPDATVAYANLYYTYPLFGPALRRHVVYAPTRPGVHKLADLPHLIRPTTGEALYGTMTQLTRSHASEATWLANLRETGATYLVVSLRQVANQDIADRPPEAVFAERNANVFSKVFDDGAVVVYRIQWGERK